MEEIVQELMKQQQEKEGAEQQVGRAQVLRGAVAAAAASCSSFLDFVASPPFTFQAMHSPHLKLSQPDSYVTYWTSPSPHRFLCSWRTWYLQGSSPRHRS